MRKGLVLASLSNHPAKGPTLSECKAPEECKELCVLLVGCHCYYRLGLNRISQDEQTVTDNLPGSVILWISRNTGEGESLIEPSDITKAPWEVSLEHVGFSERNPLSSRIGHYLQTASPGVVENSNT